MSETITLEVQGRKVEVDRSFLDLSPEQQETTVDEIASSIGGDMQGGFMANVNRGIANVADAISPFNAARAGINAIAGTDLPTDVSAQDAMSGFGVKVDRGEADGLVENFARGSGEAAAALPLVTMG